MALIPVRDTQQMNNKIGFNFFYFVPSDSVLAVISLSVIQQKVVGFLQSLVQPVLSLPRKVCIIRIHCEVSPAS